MSEDAKKPMIRHCFAHTDHWLVERLVGDEDIESVTFHGHDAEHRAKEYCLWKYGPDYC